MPMAVNQNVSYNFDVNVADALSGLDDLDKAFSNVDKAFDKLVGATKNLGSAFNVGTKATNLFKKALSTLSGVAIGKYLANATKEGIEYYETVNLFNVAMKDSVDEGKEFIATMSEMYGLDPKSLMDYTGLFYEMAYAVKVPQKAAEKMSMTLTRLTTDVASLFNMDIDTVADNLMSGMRGMSRAVLKYGMDLRATTVEAYANSKGITRQFETMNEASREILRFVVMLEQSADAQTDFAATIPSPANQLRIFKEQVSQLGRAVSRFIITPLGYALPVINGFVAALRTMVDVVADVLGFDYDYGAIRDAGDDGADSLEGVGDAAVDAGKKMKRLLAPFDELNVISESSGGSGGALGIGEIDPAVLKLLEEVEYKVKNIRLAAWDTRDAILAFFGFTPDGDSWVYSADIFEENLKKKLPNWQRTIEALFDFDYSQFISTVQQLFGSFARIGAGAIAIVTEDLLGFIGIDVTDSSLGAWIDNLNTNLENFRTYILENEGGIATMVARVIELGIAFSAFSTIASYLMPFLMFFGALGFFATNVVPLVVSGFTFIVSLFSSLFGVITGLATTFVPFSTVLTTIASSITGIVASVSTYFGSLSAATISLQGVLTGLLTPIKLLFSNVLILVAGFIDGFIQMWNKSEVFRDNFSTIATNIIGMIMSVVSMVGSAVKLVWAVLQPVISGLGDLFQPIYPMIQSIINNVIGVFTGFVNILDGIFSGDLKKVFSGLGKIVAGLGQLLSDVFASIGNVVIGTFVSAINFVGNLIYTFVVGVIKTINAIGEFVGFSLDLPNKSSFTVDEIPTIVPKSLDFTAFATGGVVTRPTTALIGEAGRSEAVIPLDNSPQMEELINRIADRISGSEQVVKVYIGDREWDAFTYESSQRGKSLIGAQPIKEGRA